MKATVKELTSTVNATIELRGISLEAYQDILNYILKVDPGAFQDAESECMEVRDASGEERKPKYAGPDGRLDILDRLFEDYAKAPADYRLENLTFEEISGLVPEFDGVGAIAFGQRYRKLQRKRCCIAMKVVVDARRRANVYTIPVRRGKTCGYLIETARKEAGLSRRELSDMIHVPVDALAAWESDRFVPSELSIGLLKNALGNDIFDRIEG